MICVELSFTGNPARLDARPAHRRRLTALHESGALLAAGPWDDGSGALLIFQLEETGVRAELTADPYYRAPGAAITSMRSWTPIIGP